MFSIFAILLVSIGVVSAYDWTTDDHESYGVYYNVPDEYEFFNKAPVNEYPEILVNGTCYHYTEIGEKSVHKGIDVYVFDLRAPMASLESIKNKIINSSDDDADFKLTSDAQDKTISGINGVYDQQGMKYVFCYIKDGKFIFIEADDDDIFEEML